MDNWRGESGYLKINTGEEGEFEYFWTEKYDMTDFEESYNICGEHYGEGKFSSLIDVTFKHAKNSLSLEFGSTLEGSACEHSYGISTISIFVK